MSKYYMYKHSRKIIRTADELLKDLKEDYEWDKTHMNKPYTEKEIKDRLELILSTFWIPVSPLLVARFNGDRETISNMVALAHENLSKLRAVLG